MVTLFATSCEVDGQSDQPYLMIVRALRDIKPDEEIVVDYGDSYNRSSYKKSKPKILTKQKTTRTSKQERQIFIRPVGRPPRGKEMVLFNR